MRHRQKTSLMTIPYRIRRNLQRFAVTLGVLAVLGAVAMAAWMLWLNRYVIYTDEGAKLDFSLSFNKDEGVIARPPEAGPDVNISYGDTDELLGLPAGSLKQMEGVVVTADMLSSKNFAATKAALEALPAGATVLLDVRNVRGEFFYLSALGRNANGIDADAVSALIAQLEKKGCYLIARFPAFRDRWYFLDDERTRGPYGLPHSNGKGELWEDTSIKNMSHYWFNPASTGALNFLVQIVTELRTLGFDEVVFADFRFPNTDNIKFTGDKTQALNEAAQTLVRSCATDSFAVSFVGTHFTLPEGRCRIYIENVAAAEIYTVTEAVTLADPAAQLVFLTDSHDTRYAAYSVLRPLDAAD